jgi:ABC-type cobalamin/Fe3+-siderophores transport system ATPase subunit
VIVRGVSLVVADRTILRDITFTASAGEITAIVGPNGVGKTTLLRAIDGYVAPSAGTIAHDERDLRALGSRERATTIASIASDGVSPEGMTLREVALMGRYAQRPWWSWERTPEDLDVVDGALAAVGLESFAERAFATLSSGERGRAWVALGLAQATPVLLLDEPTSHLDVRFALEMLDILRGLARTGKTVVCVLHDLNEASTYADRIVLLGEATQLADDVPRNVLTPENLKRAYGVAFERIEDGHRTRVFPVSG